MWSEGSKKKDGEKRSRYGNRKGRELVTRVKQRRDDEQHIHTVYFAVRHSARSAQSSGGAGAAAGSGPAGLCGQNSTGVASFLEENGEV